MGKNNVFLEKRQNISKNITGTAKTDIILH